MSTKVDERVVEMRFDNKDFESNVQTTINSVDKLKDSLQFTGASKGLEHIGEAARNVNLSGIAGAVETVQAKFSTLEVMAMTVLSRITNAAIDAGKKLIDVFAIQPVTTGFKEYELKMSSVQTIMASTGESLDTVNGYLDELNKYSDQTIYSFSDMTNNIGKFTNAGVKLEDAVMAIKGVSNEAALSGANANEASRAMYNFAQALSAGYVKLIDWKSIENANMATVGFKEQLLEAAVAAGTVEKTADGMYQVLSTNAKGDTMDGVISSTKNFNDSLSYQWMTTEVLVDTLKKYADETTEIGSKAFTAATEVKTFSMMVDTLKEAVQSGWAQTWELIFGDFEEGKTLWTELSEFFGNFISKSADARNSLLSGALDSNWEKFTARINEAGIATDDFTDKLKEVASSHGINVDKLIDKFGSLGAAIAKGKISGDIIIETLEKFTGASTEASEGWSNLAETVAQVVRGDFKNGPERVKALTEAGYDNALVQDIVNKTYEEMGHDWGTYEEVCEAATKVINEQAETFENLSDAELESMGYTKDQIKEFRSLAEEAKKTGTPLNELIMHMSDPGGRMLLVDSLMNVLKGLVNTISTVKEAWSEIFPPVTSERIYSIISRIHSLTESLILNDTQTQQLKTAFKGLFGVFDMLSSIVTGTITRAFDFLSGLWEKSGIDILGIASSVGNVILAFRDWVTQNEYITKGLDALFGALNKGVNIVGGWINKFEELPIVQECITKIKDEVAKFNADPNAYFDKMAAGIKSFIDSFKNMPIISQAISLVKQGISDFENYFKTNFPEIYAWFDGLSDKFASLNTLTLDDVTKAFQDAKNAIKEFFEGIFGSSDSTESVKEKVKKPLDETTEEVSSFKDKITGFLETIKSGLPKIDWASVLGIAASIGILKKVSDTVKILSTPLKSLSNLFDSVSSGIKEGSKAVAKLLKSFAMEVKAAALEKVAISIATLVGCIVLLSQLSNADILGSMGEIAAMAIGLYGACMALRKIPNTDKASISMLAMSASILVLVGAIKMLESVDYSKVPYTLTLLAALVITLGSLVIAIGKFAPDFKASAVSLVAVGLAIKILVGALIDIGSSELSFTLSTIVALTVVLLGLAGVVIAAGKVKLNPGAALTLVAIPIALKLFLSALNDLAKFDMEPIKNNIGKIAEILGMFAILMVASKLAGSNAAKVGIMFIGISTSLLIITGAMALLASIDASGLNRAVKVIDQILAMFAVITAASGLSGGNSAKAGVMFIGMSAAIIVLVGAIALLGELDPSKAEQGLDAVESLIQRMTLLLMGTKLSKIDGNTTKTIFALTAAISVLAVAVGALSMLDSGSVMAASVSMGVVMKVFSSMANSLSGIEFDKGMLGTVLSMSIVIAALATSVGILSTLDAQSVVASSASIAVLMKVFSQMSTDLAGITFDKKILSTVGVMALVVGGLATVIALMTNLPIADTLVNALAISAFLLAFSKSAELLATAGDKWKSIAAGAATMIVVIGVLGGIMLALGEAVRQDESGRIKEDIENFCSILEVAALGIGKAVGKFITGVLVGGLADAGTALTQFMLNIMPFVTMAQMIPTSITENIGALVKAMLMIVGGEFVNAIASGITGKNTLASFSGDLGSFIDALIDFGEKSKDVKKGPILKATEAATALTDLLKAVPNSGGLIAKFTGDNTWSTFGDGLVDFGKALERFSKKVEGIDDTVAANIIRAADASKALADLLDAVPNSGGKIAELVGDNTWTTFADGLPEYGLALLRFAASVAAIDDTVAARITMAANASKALAELLDAVPPSGGKIAELVGDKTWTAFADGLPEYGDAIKSFSESVAGIDENAADNITRSADASTALADLLDELPETGGDLQKFFGESSWSSLSDGLAGFGAALLAYSTSIQAMGDTGKEAITGSVDMVNELIELKDSLGKTGGILEFFTGKETDFEDFGKDLGKFAEAFNDFFEKSKDIKTKRLTAITDAVSSLSEVQKTINEDGNNLNLSTFGGDLEIFGGNLKTFSGDIEGVDLDSLDDVTTQIGDMVELVKSMKGLDTSGIDSFTTAADKVLSSLAESFSTNADDASSQMASAAETMMKGFVDSAMTYLGTSAKSFTTAGETLAKNLSSGVEKDGEDDFTGAYKQLMIQGIGTVSDYQDTFRTAGGTLVEKLAGGISSAVGASLLPGISSMMSRASSAIRSFHSSFYSAGVYVVEGFAGGINDNTWRAEAKARAMARASINAATATLDEGSPSKVFHKIGGFAGQGFINGLAAYEDKSYKTASEMAGSAKKGLQSTIAKMSNEVLTDVNTQPVIRPVLDLDNIRTESRKLNGMLTLNPALEASANLRAVSSYMSSRQNGTNNELISALEKVMSRNEPSNGDTFIVNGVTYDDGSNITNAVRELVRAAKVNRRV